MEIMVVVAIIGLITAVTIITFAGNTRDTELDEEAERLEALFSYVREQAELQTRDYGFRISDRNYSFVVYDVIADQWRPVDEDSALRERDISRRASNRTSWWKAAPWCSTAARRRSRISRRTCSSSPMATSPRSK